jgi:hypothetical protein
MTGAAGRLPEVAVKTLNGRNRIYVFRDLVFQADAAASPPAIIVKLMGGIPAISPRKNIRNIICLSQGSSMDDRASKKNNL